MRIPALISLVIAVGVTVSRNRKESWLWTAACVLGIAVVLSSIYPLITAKGTSATSEASPAVNNSTH